MRKIDPAMAPSWTGKPPTYLTHDDMMFTYNSTGGGRGVIIDSNNQYRLIGTSHWVTYQAKLDDVTYLLVYSKWDGGGGVYTGRLIDEEYAHIHLVETDANSDS